MWLVLLSFYFIFGAASHVLRGELAQKMPGHNRLINVVFFLFFLLPTGIILSFFFPHDLNVGYLNLIFLFGGSVIWPIFYIIAFNANKEVDVGVFAIIGNVSPVFTLAIALTLLHESLTPIQFVGIGLLILSGTLAASSQLRGSARSSAYGIMLCIVCAAVSGVAIAYERFMLTRVDFGTYLILGWGAQIAWSIILARKELRYLPTLLSHATGMKKILFAWGASSTLRSVTFIIALNIAGASLVSSASDFISVAVVIAAYFYLREREHMIYKIAAALIGVGGLFLIAA